MSSSEESADVAGSQSAQDAPLDVDGENSSPVERSTLVNLPLGEALKTEQASAITRQSDTSIVLLVGPPECGKTTLLATTYEQFHDGQFAGYLFAGSRTIVELERLCELSRLGTGSDIPDTPRSLKTAGTLFHHLTLDGMGSADGRHELLIADMHGEHYEDASNSAEDCRKLHIIRRADVLVFLLDGEALTDLTSRKASSDEVRLLFRRFIEEHMITPGATVQFVVTKWDVIASSPEKADIEKEIDLFEKRVTSLGACHSLEMSFHRIAASPKRKPELGVGYGIEGLFCEWPTANLRLVRQVRIVPVLRRFEREFDRFRPMP